jgi:aspartyl-tRNA synthetase
MGLDRALKGIHSCAYIRAVIGFPVTSVAAGISDEGILGIGVTSSRDRNLVCA